MEETLPRRRNLSRLRRRKTVDGHWTNKSGNRGVWCSGSRGQQTQLESSSRLSQGGGEVPVTCAHAGNRSISFPFLLQAFSQAQLDIEVAAKAVERLHS